jgi:hypothetical protein
MEILQRPGNVSEKFEVPTTYTDKERSALLEQRFNIAKKRFSLIGPILGGIFTSLRVILKLKLLNLKSI